MPTNASIESRAVRIPAATVDLDGDLNIPSDAKGLVMFAHGSGSGRHSPRNRYVAEVLNTAGHATLLLDLLTPAEEAIDVTTAHLRFDIELLARRLVLATDWLESNSETHRLGVGYFGASTGAAAALLAATERPQNVQAVVSRGGRPDLAGARLSDVRAPTLLIVGGNDPTVLRLNRAALQALTAEKDLVVVPGASHLFEEPGTLHEVSRLATNWFNEHLGHGIEGPE